MLRRNILLLSAGRRVELYQAIADAASRLSPDSRVICADLEPDLSAACVMCGDHVALPPVGSAGYPEALAVLCQERSIGLVIPTIDTELPVLARLRGQFQAQGTELVISGTELIGQCADKRRTAQLFVSYGIPTPELYPRTAIRFPCFSKPAAGSSSIGAFRLDQADQVSDEMMQDPDRIFMELVPASMAEFTLDLYYDRDGELKCLVPRKRLATRAGEVAKGVTRRNWLCNYLGEKLSKVRGARGCLTLQVFADEGDRRIAAIEINARFGGGVPLTIAAGADYPAWLIREYLLHEEIPAFSAWEENLLMLRYDAKVLAKNYS